MIEEPIATPLILMKTHVEQRVDPALAADVQIAQPDAQEVRARDEVFSHAADGANVAGLVGMWTGILLLHDLAVETFHDPEVGEGHLQRKKREPEEGTDE